MSEENTMQCLVIDVDIESWINRPAVTSRGEMYLIDGSKLIGKLRRASARYHRGGSGLYETVTIQPDDDTTRNYFKEYEQLWVDDMLFLKFDGVLGCIHSTQELDEDLMEKFEDLRIVDTLDFDLGICHPFFSSVEGFASYRKAQNRLRIHTKHKARRPRRSNKIKKVA